MIDWKNMTTSELIETSLSWSSDDKSKLIEEISNFGKPKKTEEQWAAYWKAKTLEAKAHLDEIKRLNGL